MSSILFVLNGKRIRILPGLLFLLMLTCSANLSLAQKIILKGKVMDEKAMPVAYASVFLKGTNKGTSTDVNGRFNLKLSSVPATIVLSAVGYDKAEKILARKDVKDSVLNISIVLNYSKTELTTVVVTALGTVRQAKEMGYSTASISAEHPRIRDEGSVRRDAAVDEVVLKDRSPMPMVAPDKTLSGKVSGLAIKESKYNTTTKPVTEKNILSPVKPAASLSKLLTAGEVNDFKKWKMWEDYTANDFKIYSEAWELFATKRYCVQLVNQDGKAVVGEKLYLVDREAGDTLWTAISDNTGKAELWSGFNKKEEHKNKSLFLAIEKDHKWFAVKPFEQGVNKIVINRICSVSNKVEIAFLVDATGSMQDEINYLKEEMEDVLSKVIVKNPELDLHTAAVFYRDKTDEYLTKVQPFTPGVKNTSDFIKEQNSGGGGDYPEAVNEGLRDAIQKLQWDSNARTRIIFLLMDAPPHTETSNEIALLTIQAAKMGIRIVPVACSGTDKTTEFIMRSMALATNGSYVYLTDDSGIGDMHIKPTTDEIKVELLNDLLQRIIEQMCFVNTCEHNSVGQEPLATYTNTENVKIFPNPSTGPVTLKATKQLKEIFVADFTGKLLMRIKPDRKSGCHFDLSAFPSGTYLIKYITEENKSGTEKLILIK